MSWDAHLNADREHYAKGGAYRGANAKDYLVFMQEQSKIENKLESGRTLARLMSDYREGGLGSRQIDRNPMGPFIIGDKVKLIDLLGDIEESKYNPLWNGSQSKVMGIIEHQNLDESSSYSCYVQWDNGTGNNYKPVSLALVYSNVETWKSWHECTACKKVSPCGYGRTKRDADKEALLIMTICGWAVNCNAEYNLQGLLDFSIEGNVLCRECKTQILNHAL